MQMVEAIDIYIIQAKHLEPSSSLLYRREGPQLKTATHLVHMRGAHPLTQIRIHPSKSAISLPIKEL